MMKFDSPWPWILYDDGIYPLELREKEYIKRGRRIFLPLHVDIRRVSSKWNAVSLFGGELTMALRTINVVPWVYVSIRELFKYMDITHLFLGTRDSSPRGSFSRNGNFCILALDMGMSMKGARKAKPYADSLLENFFVVMITPICLNRLKWKTYLIFMCLAVRT
jgi:hypothetical protein